MDYEGEWQEVETSIAKAVAGHQALINFRSICGFAPCNFAGWPVNGTSGLETSLSSGFFFFKGTRRALPRWTPSSLGLNTVSTEKSSSLAFGRMTQGLEGKAHVDADCGCRGNDVSINVDSETTSTSGLWNFKKGGCNDASMHVHSAMFDSARVRGALRCYDAIDRGEDRAVVFLARSSLWVKSERSRRRRVYVLSFIFQCQSQFS